MKTSISHNIVRCMIIIIVGVFVTIIANGLSLADTSMQIEITNSYTGSITLLPHTGMWLIDNQSNRWTNQDQARLKISAEKTTTYYLSWDMQQWPISGSGSWDYSQEYTVDLTTGQAEHQFMLQFMSNNEPLVVNTPTIIVDKYIPSTPQLLIENNIIITWDINISRSASTDTWIGLSHYIVLMWLTPNINNMVALIISRTNLVLTSANIPNGTIYRTVIAIDQLGNMSEYIIWYIHHTLPTITDWSTLTKVSWWAGGSYNPNWQQIIHYVNNNISNNGSDLEKWIIDWIPVFQINMSGEIVMIDNDNECRISKSRSLQDCAIWDNRLKDNNNSQFTIPTWYENTSTNDLNHEIVWDDQKWLIKSIEAKIIFYPLEKAIYERYFSTPVKWWILPKTWVDTSELVDIQTPNYQNYEKAIHNSWEDFVPQKRMMNRYIILIIVITLTTIGIIQKKHYQRTKK